MEVIDFKVKINFRMPKTFYKKTLIYAGINSDIN
jgi:hypothetical protein